MSALGDVAGAAVKTAARPFLPWLILGAVVLMSALLAGSFYQGWSMRGDREAATQLAAAKKLQGQIDEQRAKSDRLAGELEDEKRKIKTVTIEVIKEIPKVTTVYVEVPGEAPKAIPPAVFTWGSVGLYDRALRPDLPATAREFARPPGRTDITRAPVDTPQLLDTHVVNASEYAACRAQLNGLIDDWASRGAKVSPR